MPVRSRRIEARALGLSSMRMTAGSFRVMRASHRRTGEDGGYRSMRNLRACGIPRGRPSSRPGVIWRLVVLAGAVSLALAPAEVSAQAQPMRQRITPNQNFTANKLLRNARGLAEAGQWAEAIDLYQKIGEQYADFVTEVPRDELAGDSGLFVDIRLYCQEKIAEAPIEAVKLYREKVDPQAERWYRKGIETRDESLLRRIVDEAFCGSKGDEAIEALGDLAFQDGRFAAALAFYRRVIPDNEEQKNVLVYPAPDVDPARIDAKKLLARAALGEDVPGAADLRAFAQKYPNARGKLAGRSGLYVQILESALHEDKLAIPPSRDGRWPTFAGAFNRNRVAADPIDVGSMQWRVELTPMVSNAGMNRRFGRHPYGAAALSSDRRVPIHPIVVGDQVLVADGRHVAAYHLNDRPTSADGSGPVDVAWKHDEYPASSGPQPAAFFSYDIPHYTLTAYGDRIYARMGPPGSSFGGGMGMGMGPAVPTAIIALDRSTDGKLRWKVGGGDIPLPLKKDEARNSLCGFEGSPVADDRNVYAALTEGGEMTSTYIACLSAETGSPRWVRYLFASMPSREMNRGPMMGIPAPDVGHRLLSLEGGMLYYQSNQGALAALDAETGAIRWIASYPQEDAAGGFTPSHKRDLNPAVVHDGMVIVAPDDIPYILAYHALTGKLLWKIDPQTEIMHLLGVAKGKLVATGDHVITIDVKTGKRLSKWPDNPSGFDGYGRGVLAGDSIYWPTRTEIHVLDQETGLRGNQPPIKLKESFQTGGGNLAVGDGYLVVARNDSLVVFCQNSRLIKRYMDEIAHDPARASNYYRLARVAEATGKDELSLENLDRAIEKARPSEMIDGQSLVESAWNQRYRLLIKLADRDATGGRWAKAAERYESAARAGRSTRDRLTARLKLADARSRGGDDSAAVAVLQNLLSDEPIRFQTVVADDHRSVRADLLITNRLTSLLRTRGRAIYEPYDRAARELLTKGVAEKNPRLIEDVCRLYPVSDSVSDAWLELGKLRDSNAQPVEAASAYKRLFASAIDDRYRARALMGLAKSYESRRLWVPARETYARLGSRFGAIRLEDLSMRSVGDVVSERLNRPPFDRLAVESAEPSLPVPLGRRWNSRRDRAIAAVAAAGASPATTSGPIFLVDKTIVKPVDPETGKSAWSADLGEPPIWIGYLADRVIIAGKTKIAAAGAGDGTIEWRYDMNAPKNEKSSINPFARGRVEPAATEGEEPDELGRFQIVGGRVFALRGDRELIAFDGDSGLIDWSYSPRQGSLNPNVWIGSERIVAQERDPASIVVLETATGRGLNRIARPSGEEAWPRVPVPLDNDRVVLVPDRFSVALLDLSAGKIGWTFSESKSPPLHGPPRVLGDSERLLVLHDGRELIRLDPAGGGKLWSQTLGADDIGEREDALVLDGNQCYYVTGSTQLTSPPSLSALSLADGAILWSRYLAGPKRGWSLALSDRCVAAFSNPKADELSADIDSAPLALYQRKTGDLVERLVFPAENGRCTARLTPRGAIVATSDGIWSLGDRSAQTVDSAAPTR